MKEFQPHSRGWRCREGYAPESLTWGSLKIRTHLVGGFKYVLFSSLFGEDSHFDYFSKGLKPPTSILFQSHNLKTNGLWLYNYISLSFGSCQNPASLWVNPHTSELKGNPFSTTISTGFPMFVFSAWNCQRQSLTSPGKKRGYLCRDGQEWSWPGGGHRGMRWMSQLGGVRGCTHLSSLHFESRISYV